MNAQLHHTVAIGRLADLRLERGARRPAAPAVAARRQRRPRVSLRRRVLRQAV